MLLWLLFALFVGFLAGKWTTVKEVIPNKGPHKYFLRSYKAPRMSGAPLAIMASLFDIPVIGHLLSFILFRRNMFHTLRSLDLSCTPTYFPLVHDFSKDTEIDSQSKLSAEEFLKRELESVDEKDNKDNIYNQVKDFARAYKTGNVLPSDITKKVIAAIKTGDSQELSLRYVLNVNEEDAMQQAKASDERFKSGNPLSIFDGVPVTVKDEFEVKGHPTTCGTRVYNAIAVEDATVAFRLRKAGAILIGKANMIETGMGTKGVNPHHGSARNPYNLQHHTGGSSSGSAAAAASGMFPMTIGADGGGSIRIPAALCGAVGLKPTFGRVPEHGAFPLCWTVAHAGPLANSVRDCALGYAVIAGADEKDNMTLLQPPVILPNLSSLSSSLSSSPLKGMRVGIYTPWFNHADPEVVKSCKAAVDILSSLGGEIVEVPVLEGILEHSRLSHTAVIISEMAAALSAKFDNPTRSLFGLDTRITLSVTRPLTARDYILANRMRTLAIEGVKKVFEKVDILVTPTTAAVAPRFGTVDGKEDVDIEIEGLMMRYCFLGNFTGIPGVSVPCGYTPEGLPIGLQVMGKWWEEHVLLSVAYLLEQHIEKRSPRQLFTYL